jgi:DNA-binding NarL/FixJ family response regulator
MTTSIMVVDDHAVFRAGLTAIIKTLPAFQLVGEASTCGAAVDIARRTRPEVISMDLGLPDESGVSCIAAIRHFLPDVKVLVLTVSDKEEDLFAALKAGALGYVLKDVALNELVNGLKLVAAGEAIISPSMASKLMQEFQSLGKKGTDSELSPRELEVLDLVARGLSNKRIGFDLFISESTVKAHLRSIMDKLHVRNRAQAVAIASSRGILKALPAK